MFRNVFVRSMTLMLCLAGAACGGPQGDASDDQGADVGQESVDVQDTLSAHKPPKPVLTSYIIDPTTCGGNSTTSITVYVAPQTNYCTFLTSNTSGNCPPNLGEKVLVFYVGKSGATVTPVTPGTYQVGTSDSLYTVAYQLTGDGTQTCSANMATSGTIKIRSIAKGGAVTGSYRLQFADGTSASANFDAPLCWEGQISCG